MMISPEVELTITRISPKNRRASILFSTCPMRFYALKRSEFSDRFGTSEGVRDGPSIVASRVRSRKLLLSEDQPASLFRFFQRTDAAV